MKRLQALVRHVGFIYGLAALVSIIFSTWLSYREVVVNSDAICYLMSAKEIAISGLKEAMQICPQAKWPFYSILIDGLSRITSINHLISAYILDAFFTMISVITFIAIVRKMGGSIKVLWFAAFTILFAHEFNSVRQYIVRDHGFWAFYLLSVFCMIQYYAKPAWRYVAAWVVSLVIATLFRIEGVVFLALTPLLVFLNKIDISYGNKGERLNSVKQQAILLLKLYSPMLVAVLLLAVWLVSKGALSSVHWGRFAEVYAEINSGVHNIAWRYESSRLAMVKHVLPPESAREASLLWVSAIIVSYFVNIIQNLYWVCALLIAYAWSRKLVPLRHPVSKVLVAYLVVNLAITASFYGQHLFLSKRYLIALSLILWLWVPFALAELSRLAKDQFSRFIYYFSILLIISSSVGVFLGLGPSKDYLRTAASWVESEVPENAKFYTNDYQLLYYTKFADRNFFKLYKQYENLANALAHANSYDYLAIQVSRHDHELDEKLKKIALTKVKRFENKRGDHLVVYKTP